MNFNNCHITFNIKIKFNHSNSNSDINETDLDTNLNINETDLDTDLNTNLDINENDLDSNSDSNLDINENDLDTNLDSNLNINEIDLDSNSDINKIKKNRYLITCCCGITYRNVYRNYYNDIYNLDSNLYKNQNERHYKTPIHQLYITNKEIVDKINNTYNTNLLNLNLRKLNSLIKTNKDVININTSKKINDNNFRKYKKLELLNLIIDVFKPQANEFIINNTNIYKLKIVDLYKLIKDNNIDIKNIKKYKKEELIDKIIEIYTAPPKEFILFNTNIYNLKIVDLYKFINDHNINLIMTRIRSYTKEELLNKIIELYS